MLFHTIKENAVKWFKTILSEYKSQQSEKVLTEPEKYLAIIVNINSDKFKGFNNSSNATIEVKSVFPTIEHLVNTLYFFKQSLIAQKAIYAGLAPQEEVTTTVGKFFLSDDQRYVDEHILIEEFINVSHEFITLLEQKKHAQSGADAHNYRVLFYFKKHLHSFAQQLVEMQN